MNIRFAVGVLLVVVLLSSTGRAAAGTPTQATWAAAANARCAAANALVRSLPKPTNNAKLIADLRATARVGRRLTIQLAAIPRPTSKRLAIQKLITIARTEVNYLQDLADAIFAGDSVVTKQLTAKLEMADARLNGIARSLGARVCAQNPEPQG